MIDKREHTQGNVTITFDPNNHDIRDTVALWLSAGDWKQVVWELDQYLRGITKHGDHDKERVKVAEEFRTKLWEEVNDRNLNLLD